MNNDQKLNGLSFDRAGFVVALSAALLALIPFKDAAEKIPIYLFGLSPSLYQLSAIFLSTLIVSAYFSGLNQIRFNLPWLLRFRWLRIFEWTSQALYTFAFVMPLVVTIGWGLSALLKLFPIHVAEYLKFATLVVQSITAILSVVTGYFVSRTAKTNASDALDDARANIAIRKDTSYYEGDYRVFVLQLFQSVIAALEGLLVKRLGIPARQLPAATTIRTAQQLEIIDKGEAAIINDLRATRNRIAHDVGTIEITKAQADNYRAVIAPLLERLEQLRE